MARNEERRPEGPLSQFVMRFESLEQETDTEHSGRVRSQEVGAIEVGVAREIACGVEVFWRLVVPGVPEVVHGAVHTSVFARIPWLTIDHVVDFLVGAPLVTTFCGCVLHKLRGVLVSKTTVKVHVERIVVRRCDGGRDA